MPVVALCWLLWAGWLRFETGSFVFATVPGRLGIWWRRNWYERTLQRCGQRLRLNWMAYIYLLYSILGGVPAKVIRQRAPGPAGEMLGEADA